MPTNCSATNSATCARVGRGRHRPPRDHDIVKAYNVPLQLGGYIRVPRSLRREPSRNSVRRGRWRASRCRSASSLCSPSGCSERRAPARPLDLPSSKRHDVNVMRSVFRRIGHGPNSRVRAVVASVFVPFPAASVPSPSGPPGTGTPGKGSYVERPGWRQACPWREVRVVVVDAVCRACGRRHRGSGTEDPRRRAA